MKKEVINNYMYCDCCGKQFEYPTAIYGSWNSGWEHINEYDTCDICTNTIKSRLYTQTPESILIDEIKKLKEENNSKHPNLNFGIQYT